MPTEPGISQLYDSLSRYQWWRRRFSRRRPDGFGGSGLEMRKALLDPGSNHGPRAGSAGLDDWLFDLAVERPGLAILDVGCGFGATLIAWAQRGAARCVGLSLSRYQIGKAAKEAARHGVQAVCAFRQQSYDDPIEELYDVVVSIESLLHSPDLEQSIANLSSILAPGGVLALVEDMAVDADQEQHPLAQEFLRLWSTESLHSLPQYRAALSGSGLQIEQEIDLTEQVRRADADVCDRRARRLQRWRRWMPVGRRVVDAFLGGIRMEQLYAEGQLTYRTLIARRS